jgi:hypothetical protein
VLSSLKGGVLNFSLTGEGLRGENDGDFFLGGDLLANGDLNLTSSSFSNLSLIFLRWLNIKWFRNWTFFFFF